jgi:D-tagatose 6-phosphate 4-epimerase
MSNPLLELAAARREGSPRGITSICSAHPVVIRAAARRGTRNGEPVLIEATCNQVNQYGGYTGLTPEQLAAFVLEIARGEGLDPGRVILGGDHLGPNPWRKESAGEGECREGGEVADRARLPTSQQERLIVKRLLGQRPAWVGPG